MYGDNMVLLSWVGGEQVGGVVIVLPTTRLSLANTFYVGLTAAFYYLFYETQLLENKI